MPPDQPRKTGPHPDEVREAAYLLYTRHPRPLSLQEIATFLTEKFGRPVHKVSVRDWLQAAGVSTTRKRPPRIPREVGDEAEKLYRRWRSTRKVAVVLRTEGKRVSRDWVRKELLRRGVQLAPPGRPKRRKNAFVQVSDQ